MRFDLVDAAGLGPFVAGLRRLERDVTYPIADGGDRFFINHGAAYHPFFSAMGEAFFAIAHDEGGVAGVAVGVNREVDWCGRRLRSFYICDLKVAPRRRGERLVERMVAHAASRLFVDPRLRRFRLVYGAAMRGARGDVMRSARPLHPLRLLHSAAVLRLYFVAPAALAALSPAGAPPPPSGPGLDLSCQLGAASDRIGAVSTAGSKDLRLVSTGAPWPLHHLAHGPSRWERSWGDYLARAGAALVEQRAEGQACFAIDERLGDHVTWLAGQGIAPGAACTVYALAPALPAPRWVHLATSEI